MRKFDDLPKFALFPELQKEVGELRQSGLSRERLPTNTTTHLHPIHRWFNFIAGFSPEFVGECLDSAGLGTNAVVLDPFAGCATSLLVASHRGFPSAGFEPHPFFARIARGKLTHAKSTGEFERISQVIKAGLLQPKPVGMLGSTPATYLLKLFPETSLQSLLGAREALRESGQDCDLGFLCLSKLLEKCSHSQTDGIYKAPTTRKTAVFPEKALDQVSQMVCSDIRKTRSLRKSSSFIFEHSSENMTEIIDNAVSLVVTSPPYLNNFDFAEMTRMHFYFWGMANSWGEITEKIRSRLILNTTTALKAHRKLHAQYREETSERLRPQLDLVVKQLSEKRKEKGGKKEYDLIVFPYFCQMGRVLRECYRVLRPGAYLHMMIADAALYGVHISSPQYLGQLLESLGFTEVQLSLVRRRGQRWILSKREGSSTGLGEYHIQARKKAE